jgi:hypothetical protein
MRVQRTAEEVLANYVDRMGQQLGGLFNAISHEVKAIHLRWSQYRILFGETPQRIKLLDEAAPLFFRIVQTVFAEDTVLSIARITSPAKSAGRSNLTINRFPVLVTRPTKGHVSELVEATVKASNFTVDPRRRYLAHRDLSLALKDPAVQQLSSLSREQIEGALTALRNLLNYIEGIYCNEQTVYLSSMPGDAKKLLDVVRHGLARQRDRRR